MLENRVLLGLGRISYSAYVMHLVVVGALLGVAGRLNVELEQGPLKFGLATLATFSLAWLSWRFLESPILALKRFFPYRQHDA